MTLGEAYRYGREKLEAAGVSEAPLDAWYLLEYASGCSKSHYLAYPEEILPEEGRARFLKGIERRARRIPLQHITGEQEFMGLVFRVNDKVLIPRQDTEILVEEAARRLKPGMRFLDLCTGSGCILLSLLRLCPGAEGVGADISEEALKVAEQNRGQLAVEARLVRSDLFDELDGKFDMIVSNPPYIKRGDLAGLMVEVREHEPRLALDGHEDGLYFYRRIARESRSFLGKGGSLYLEIGYDQGALVPKILKEQGFCEIEVVKDLASLDRVVKGIYSGGE